MNHWQVLIRAIPVIRSIKVVKVDPVLEDFDPRARAYFILYSHEIINHP